MQRFDFPKGFDHMNADGSWRKRPHITILHPDGQTALVYDRGEITREAMIDETRRLAVELHANNAMCHDGGCFYDLALVTRTGVPSEQHLVPAGGYYCESCGHAQEAYFARCGCGERDILPRTARWERTDRPDLMPVVAEQQGRCMRPNDVSRLAGVPLAEVQEVPASDVIAAHADRQSAEVLECLEAVPATYWMAGGRYWFDDPGYGDVAAVDRLDYDPDLGLVVRD